MKDLLHWSLGSFSKLTIPIQRMAITIFSSIQCACRSTPMLLEIVVCIICMKYGKDRFYGLPGKSAQDPQGAEQREWAWLPPPLLMPRKDSAFLKKGAYFILGRVVCEKIRYLLYPPPKDVSALPFLRPLHLPASSWKADGQPTL